MSPSPSAPRPLLPPGGPLPAWCDAFLPADDVFLGRAWWDTTLAHALAPGASPALARAGDDAALLLLLEEGGRLRSLSTPYTLLWSPLPRPGAAEAELRRGGRELAGALRWRGPVRLEALGRMPPPLLDGLRAGGLVPLPYRHFGRWHEVLPKGEGWAGYLARRPPALRTTVSRKLARAAREGRFEWIASAGPGLEEGVAAFEAIRAASWKPEEPFPRFDGALMRALAPLGALRLGVLRNASDGAPIAAQYWVLDAPGGGPRRATVPKLFHAEAAKAASPGTALTAWAIRRLIEEDGVRILDFGRGDDPYKAQWVGEREQRMGLVLASPLHPAGLAEIARAAARRAAARLGRTPGRRFPAQANLVYAAPCPTAPGRA